MKIYIYEGKKHKGSDGKALIQKALKDYSQGEYGNAEILKGKYGKPFFKDVPVHFSVSHTGNIWACLMAEFEVGVDIQMSKNVKYQSVAERFFTKQEADYIREKGVAGFFEVWTRKEAFVKYTGKGFANQSFAGFSVTEQKEGKLYLRKTLDGIYIKNIDLEAKLSDIIKPDIKIYSVGCVKENGNITVKEL